jgi:hypothetical protein
MDSKANLIVRNSIFRIYCGSPYGSDRPWGHIDALHHEKWAGTGDVRAGVGTPTHHKPGHTPQAPKFVAKKRRQGPSNKSVGGETSKG